MTLVWRISLLVILLGLLVGFVMRLFVRQQRLPLLLAVSGLPWFFHLLYIVSLIGENPDRLFSTMLSFALVSVVLALVLYLVMLGMARRRPLSAFLFPLALGAVYGVVLLSWYVFGLRDAGLIIDNISYARLVWGTLFFSAALFSFSLRPPKPRLPAVTLPFMRRR